MEIISPMSSDKLNSLSLSLSLLVICSLIFYYIIPFYVSLPFLNLLLFFATKSAIKKRDRTLLTSIFKLHLLRKFKSKQLKQCLLLIIVKIQLTVLSECDLTSFDWYLLGLVAIWELFEEKILWDIAGVFSWVCCSDFYFVSFLVCLSILFRFLDRLLLSDRLTPFNFYLISSFVFEVLLKFVSHALSYYPSSLPSLKLRPKQSAFVIGLPYRFCSYLEETSTTYS